MTPTSPSDPTYTDEYFRANEDRSVDPFAEATAQALARMAEAAVKGPKVCPCEDKAIPYTDEDGNGRCMKCAGLR